MYLTWQTLFQRHGWVLSNFKILHRETFDLHSSSLQLLLLEGIYTTCWDSVWYHSFRLDIQTRSLDTIFPAFSLLHTLDIHWNFGKLNAWESELYEYFRTSWERDFLFLHSWRNTKPVFLKAVVIFSQVKECNAFGFFFVMWNWMIILTSLYIWKQIKINQVNVLCQKEVWGHIPT